MPACTQTSSSFNLVLGTVKQASSELTRHQKRLPRRPADIFIMAKHLIFSPSGFLSAYAAVAHLRGIRSLDADCRQGIVETCCTHLFCPDSFYRPELRDVGDFANSAAGEGAFDLPSLRGPLWRCSARS